jgi:hypothetical protein
VTDLEVLEAKMAMNGDRLTISMLALVKAYLF